MKRISLVLALLAATALAVPLGAAAKPRVKDPLLVRILAPITFSEPTGACTDGVAHYGVGLKGARGSGTNCLQGSTVLDCPAGSDAFFCQEVHHAMTLRLPGGTIEADAAILELDRCGDAECSTVAIEQQWSGDVTRATRRFHKLNGGSVSGGGRLVLDAATFEILTIDEVLAIDG